MSGRMFGESNASNDCERNDILAVLETIVLSTPYATSAQYNAMHMTQK